MLRRECKKYKLIDDKFIVLNVEDDYEYLNMKTLILLQTINKEFPNIKGLFKCDDDVIVNLNNIRNFIKDNKNINIFYSGHVIDTTKYFIINRSRKYPLRYCGGPLYYLNRNAIKCFREEVNNIIMNSVEYSQNLNDVDLSSSGNTFNQS